MVFGRNTKFLQSIRSNDQRIIRNSIDEGSSFIVVSHRVSFFKLTIFPKSSGNLSNFEHPKRSRLLSNVKLQMVLGRHTRFLQPCNIKIFRPVKHSIDEGNSIIAMHPKRSFCKRFMFPTNFGIFLTFAQ